MQRSPLDRYRAAGPLSGPIIVYLLHVAYANGEVEHYVGSTKVEAFKRRMRAHAGGYGTKTTGGMYGRRPTIHLVRTWDRPNRTWETTLLRDEDHRAWCSICAPEFAYFVPPVRDPFRLDGVEPEREGGLSLSQHPPRYRK